MMKEARVSWNKPMNAWVIRFWSEHKKEWLEDSWYPVKDVDENTEYGWVSELLIVRLYELEDLGYKIVFVR